MLAVTNHVVSDEGTIIHETVSLEPVSTSFRIPETAMRNLSLEHGLLVLQGGLFALKEERIILEALRSANILELSMASWESNSSALHDITRGTGRVRS